MPLMDIGVVREPSTILVFRGVFRHFARWVWKIRSLRLHLKVPSLKESHSILEPRKKNGRIRNP